MCCFHSNYEQWAKKINNSGITAPFNFVSQRSLCGNASDLSLSLFISSPSFSLWLQDTCHLMPFTKYSLLDQSYFFTSCLSIAHIKFTNKIHQLFTDYLLRLPYSELLETHLFRSRANRRLVSTALHTKVLSFQEKQRAELWFPPKKDLNFLPSLTAKDVIFSGFV